MHILFIEREDYFSKKYLKTLKVAKASLLYLWKYNQEWRDKLQIKVSTNLALENEWVENDIRSLCTNSIGLVACKALPLEKDSNVVCQEHNLDKLYKWKIL